MKGLYLQTIYFKENIMELPIARLFLEFRETVFQQIAEMTEMVLGHDHQIRTLRAEITHLKSEIKNHKLDVKKNVDEDNIPF